MQGLERVYYDLDNIRKRLVRLVEMERIPEPAGIAVMTPVLKLMERVNGYIEKGIESDTDGDGGGGGGDKVTDGSGEASSRTEKSPD